MERTWKPTAAGILCIIVGVVVVVISGMLVALGVGPATTSEEPIGVIILIFFGIPSIMLGIVAIVGDIYALRRNIWGLALVGSIALVGFAGCGILQIIPIVFVAFGVAGILAIVFVVLGRGEFKVKALAGDISPKSRLATSLLAFFLGVFGTHRFYIGKTGTAVAMLVLGILGCTTMRFLGSGFIFFL